MSPIYRIKIPFWSATDYSYLVNNNLGWVSDDFRYYEFENEEDELKMQKYLESEA